MVLLTFTQSRRFARTKAGLSSYTPINQARGGSHYRPIVRDREIYLIMLKLQALFLGSKYFLFNISFRRERHVIYFIYRSSNKHISTIFIKDLSLITNLETNKKKKRALLYYSSYMTNKRISILSLSLSVYTPF